MQIKAYNTESTLNFILELPVIDSRTYDYIHLYSIPNPKNLTIIPKFKYLILGSEEYSYGRDKCQSVQDDILLCTQLEMKPLKQAGDCITSLIQHNSPVDCIYTEINIGDFKIQKINHMWLIITPETASLRTDCQGKTSYRSISGINIIQTSDDCRILIFNQTLQLTKRTVVMNEIIPLPENPSITGSSNLTFKINIKEISMDNLRNTIENIEQLENKESWNWSLTQVMQTPSWMTIAIYISCSLYISWKIYKLIRQKKKSLSPTPGPERTPESRQESGFHLKEGGVKPA